MKKLVSIILVLLLMIPAGAFAAFSVDAQTTVSPKYEPNENWGPNEDGNFEIATPSDLLAFCNNANRVKYNSYKGAKILLTADIDLNPGWDASTKTQPTNVYSYLEHLRGEFDGQGHTIRGLYMDGRKTDSKDAVFVRSSQYGLTMRNFKIENTYFTAETGYAGLVEYTRGKVVLENIYVDAIFEAGTYKDGKLQGAAAGFVCFFRATAASYTPDLTLTNCVFAGSVTGATYAGGIVGTNDKPSHDNETGSGTYNITMTDCANYGTVIGMTPTTPVAGVIGSCANKATVTRCYNAGTVGTALANVSLSSKENADGIPVVINFDDCYYQAGAGVVGIHKAVDATATVNVNYDGAAAADAKTATPTELVTLNAFKNTWTLVDGKAVPTAISCLAGAHNYVAGTVVAPDRCLSDGYTPYTCTVCNNTKKDNVVAKAAHTYVETVVAPTCASEGYTEHKCSVCEDTYTDNAVAMLDHIEGDWIVDKAATEAKAGLRHKECTICAKILVDEVIPALTPSGNTETQPATDTAASTETAATDTAKGGCGSSIALGSAFAMVTMMSLGVTVLRKKER